MAGTDDRGVALELALSGLSVEAGLSGGKIFLKQLGMFYPESNAPPAVPSTLTVERSQELKS